MVGALLYLKQRLADEEAEKKAADSLAVNIPAPMSEEAPPSENEPTQEERDAAKREKYQYGIYKAIGRGAVAAWDAFGELANAFKTNTQFRNWTLGTIGLGLAPVAVAASAPGAITATATGLTNPVVAQGAGDFVAGMFDLGPPPMSAPGVAGYTVKEAYDRLKK